MEQRLIDANALVPDTSFFDGGDWHYGYSAKQLETAPTVDAVPVVRCRECEHMKKKRFVYADGRIEYYKRCELDNRERPNEYFCADGERRADEQ